MWKPLSQGPNNHKSTSFIEILFRSILFSFVAAILFSRVVSNGISHDEYQFVASSQVFATHGKIPYLDYPFLHMPYQVPVNSIAVLLTDYHLLTIRSLNALFFLASILLVFFLITQTFKNQSAIYRNLAGTLSILLFLFDPSFIGMDGRALNHALPVLLSLLALLTFQNWLTGKQTTLPILGCGILVGLATGVRLSFAVLALPFLLILAFYPNLSSITERLKLASIFVIGVILALLPVVVLMLLAPDEFFFGNYVYIKLNTIYRQEVLFQHSMTPSAKIQYFFKNILSHPGPLVLYTGLLLAALYLFARLIRREVRGNIMLSMSVLLSFVLLGSSFAPTPLWPQYFFAPVPFVVISVFSCISIIQKVFIRRLLMIGIAAAVILGFPLQATEKQFDVLGKPARWIPIQTHNFAHQVQELAKRGKVVTLAPIYPMEAGLETYPPFIVGPFVWRTAPLLSARGREQYGITSFHELEAMLDADPPVAVVTGVETDYGFDAYSFGLLEKPFIDYAIAHGYEPKLTTKPDFWPTNITIWVKKQ